MPCHHSLTPYVPESVDGGEVSDVPDVERGVEDVHLLELVDLRLRVAQPAVQAPVAVLGRQQVALVLGVLAPVPLLVPLQARLLLELCSLKTDTCTYTVTKFNFSFLISDGFLCKC